MIKNLIKHFYQQNTFAKIAVLLSLFVLSSSCNDQGCIDADDFGEYESQTIEVTSNSTQSGCDYDLSKPLDDVDAQAGGVRICFTSGDKSVTDENNITKSVAANATIKGCEGFSTYGGSFRSLCISQCVQECIAKSISSSSTSEPSWTSTTKRSTSVNDGVTIMPGAEITVNAAGSISLGDSVNYPDVYVQADNHFPHTKYSNWSDVFFDVRGSQSLDLKFSGTWNNGDTIGNSAFGVTGNTGLSSSGTSASDLKIYNSARRLVAFVIPHPTGYDFNKAQTDEKLAAKGVPLLPDYRLWTCTYADNAGVADATCSAGAYAANGYTSVTSDAAVAAVFPLSAEVETSVIGTVGGMIRWNEDGTKNGSNHAEYDPFAEKSVSGCNLTDPCPNFASSGITPDVGQIVGDASVSQVVILSPSSTNSYKVSFKNLSTNASCNLIKIWIKDGVSTDGAIGNILDNGGGTSGKSITLSTTAWSSDHISLEPNQKIVIDKTNNSCGKGIGVRFNKYKDIKINQSGLVSFSMLGSGSGSCTINGRIINPDGSHSNATFSSTGAIYSTNTATTQYTADFYEYDNFLSSSSKDPLNSLSVSPGSWTAPVFLRKGQKIRFSPSSWNENWSGSSLSVNCGIGMAMSITPRPALLCRGVASDLLTNPACVQQYDSTSGSPVLIGCQATAKECTDETSTANYCPITNCQKTVTCTTPGTSPTYARTGCTLGGTIVTSCSSSDTACNATLCSYNSSADTGTKAPYFDSATCNNCSNLKLNVAKYPAKISLTNADQCYDLEGYTGKVANIPIDTGFPSGDFSDSLKTKGAVKLSVFNGSYGNFENFYDTNTVDANGNRLFKLTSPIIFTQEGRLRFFLLDGNDFNGAVSSPATGGAYTAYANNSTHGSSYSNNGMRISLSGMLSFSNGQWMEAKLCRETSDSSVECRGNPLTSTGLNAMDLRSPSTKLSDQPHLVDITPPTTAAASGSSPTITSPYKFDGSGNLVRTAARSTNDCTNTLSNSYFYCHTHDYFSDEDFKAKTENGQSEITNDIQKLRLTFKILDPEIASCNKASPSSTDATTFDGIIVTNSYYNPSTSSNTGATCGATEVPGSTGCQKQFYCADKYTNNTGSYFVNVKVKNPSPSTVSSVIGGVITPIIQVMDGDGGLRDCSSTGGLLSASYDGVKTNNPLYDDSVSSYKDAICTSGETNCKKQYYCKISNSVGQAERVYRALISDSRYKAIVTMCIIVMFTFYGVGFLMGVSELNHSEIINRIIKIGLIYLFIGETGWDWFNMIVVRFFKNSTDYLAFMMASSFDDSPNIAGAMESGDYYDKSVLFSSVDQVFNMFFSPSVQKKISALLFASIFGWLYMIIIYGGFMLYILAVANAVLLYLTAQVFISILFTLGPIFFIFTLFSQTKDMFDNWLKQLISFSLQQIFLLTTLAFFNMLMYEVIKLSLGYKICWAEVWSINILIHISLMSFWTIASLPPRTNAQSSVGNIGNPEGIPSLFSILFIYVIASLMNKFVTFMTDVAASIGGGLAASKMGAGIKAAVAEAAKAVKGRAAKAFDDAGGNKLIARMDDKLFDSGAIADKRKADEKAASKKMSADKSALKSAGKKAVSDYKKNNGAALAGMSQPEQKKALEKAKNDAINKAGKARGLNDKEIAAVKSSKGSKYAGDNLAMAAISAARNSRAKSMNDEGVDTTLSASENKAAMKNTDAAGRAKMVEAAKSGNLKVSRSTTGKMLQAGSNAKKSIGAAGKAAKGAAKTAKAKLKDAKAAASAGATKAKAAAAGAASSAMESAKSAKAAVASLGTEEGRKAAIDSASKGVSDAKAAISGAATGAVESAGKAATAAKEGIKSGAESAKESVKSAGAAVKSLGTAEGRQAAVEGAKGAATSAVQSASNAAKSAKTAASSAASAASSAGSKVATAAGKAYEATKSEDTKGYEEAREQLIAEGEIDTMATGTEWARDDKQKEAIKQRQALNKAQKATDNYKPDAGAIADMEMEQDYLNESDAISPDASLVGQIDQKIAAKIKRMNPNSQKKKDKMSAAKDAAHDGMRDKVGKDLAVTEAEQAANQKDIGALQEDLANISEKIDNMPEAQAINKAKAAVTNAGNRKDKKAAEAELKKLENNKSPELAKLEKAKDKTNAGLSKATVKGSNLAEKAGKLEKTAKAMDKAKAIKDSAKQKVTPKAKVKDPVTDDANNTATEDDNKDPAIIERDNLDAPELDENSTEGGSNSEGGDDNNPNSDEGDANAADSPKTPAQQKIADLRDKNNAIKESAPQRKEDIKADTEAKAKARSEAPTPKTPKKALNKAISNIAAKINDTLGAAVATRKVDREVETAEKSLDYLDKAEAMIESAEEILNKPGADPSSKEYKEAEETKKSFEAIDNDEDLEKFVKAGEERASEVEDQFNALKTPDDFERFNNQHES